MANRLTHKQSRALKARAYEMMDAGRTSQQIAKELKVKLHRIHNYLWERRTKDRNGSVSSRPASVTKPISTVTTVTPPDRNQMMFVAYGPEHAIRPFVDHLVQTMKAK